MGAVNWHQPYMNRCLTTITRIVRISTQGRCVRNSGLDSLPKRRLELIRNGLSEQLRRRRQKKSVLLPKRRQLRRQQKKRKNARRKKLKPRQQKQSARLKKQQLR